MLGPFWTNWYNLNTFKSIKMLNAEHLTSVMHHINQAAFFWFQGFIGLHNSHGNRGCSEIWRTLHRSIVDCSWIVVRQFCPFNGFCVFKIFIGELKMTSFGCLIWKAGNSNSCLFMLRYCYRNSSSRVIVRLLHHF